MGRPEGPLCNSTTARSWLRYENDLLHRVPSGSATRSPPLTVLTAPHYQDNRAHQGRVRALRLPLSKAFRRDLI